MSNPPVPDGTTITHPNGTTFTVGECAPDDGERISCDQAGTTGHSGCGTHPCCGWPRFLGCPC